MLWHQQWRDSILHIKREAAAVHESLEGYCQRLQRKAATRCGYRYPGASDPTNGVPYRTTRPILTALAAHRELTEHPTDWPVTQVHGDDFWKAPVGSGFIVFYKGAQGKGHVALCIRELREGLPVWVMYDNMRMRRMGVGWSKRVIGAFKFK